MTEERIAEIKGLCENATAGPWRWRFNDRIKNDGPDLIAPHSGTLYVMGFARRGMRGAEPTFSDRTKDEKGRWQGGIMYKFSEWWKRSAAASPALAPDADFIARSREIVPELVAEVERLKAALEAIAEATKPVYDERKTIPDGRYWCCKSCNRYAHKIENIVHREGCPYVLATAALESPT